MRNPLHLRQALLSARPPEKKDAIEMIEYFREEFASDGLMLSACSDCEEIIKTVFTEKHIQQNRAKFRVRKKKQSVSLDGFFSHSGEGFNKKFVVCRAPDVKIETDDYKNLNERVEYAAIIASLTLQRSKKETAALLGVSTRTLHNKLLSFLTQGWIKVNQS